MCLIKLGLDSPVSDQNWAGQPYALLYHVEHMGLDSPVHDESVTALVVACTMLKASVAKRFHHMPGYEQA